MLTSFGIVSVLFFVFLSTFENLVIMGKFTRLRKNKSYDYKPRYFDDKGEGNPYKIEHKLDKYRTTVGPKQGLKSKFGNAFSDLRKEGDRNMKIRMAIIIAILVFAFLYIIDFDLSIFSIK